MRQFKFLRPNEPIFDPYWDFVPKEHFRPLISKADFYKHRNFELAKLLVNPLLELTGGSEAENELLFARSFSLPQKALYYWWHFHKEMNDGGLIKFYLFSFEHYIPAIIKGLELVGDKKLIQLIQKADLIFRRQKQQFERDGKDIFGDNIIDNLIELTPLDDKYERMSPDTMALMEQFLRLNVQAVCVDENGEEYVSGFTL